MQNERMHAPEMGEGASLDSGDDFPVYLPDQHPAYGLDRTQWKPRRAFLLRPRQNGVPGYWWPESERRKCSPEMREGSGRSTAAFLEALAPLDIGEDDVWSACTEDASRERSTSYSWPRSLPWSSLPYVAAPQFALQLNGPSPLRRGAPQPTWISEDCSANSPVMREALLRSVAGADVFVLDHPAPDAEDLADVANILDISTGHGRGEPWPLLLWFDGSKMRPLDPVHVRTAQAEWAAHERFHWNHILNARILCGRAAAAAIRQTLEGRQADYRVDKVCGAGHFLEFAWSPYTIQAMFHLGRNGDGHGSESPPSSISLSAASSLGKPPSKAEIDDSYHAEARAAVLSGLAEYGPDGTMRWIWRGTGSYPAWHAPWEDIVKGVSFSEAFRGGRERNFGAIRKSGGTGYGIFTLVWAGLVEVGPGGGYVLTDAGRRYLDIVGPELDDPDMLLRWRTADGRIGSPADVPSMDRWLNRAFRSVKRRVASLPRSLPHDRGVAVWNQSGTGLANKSAEDSRLELTLVMGRTMQFRLEDMGEEGFPGEDILAAMAAAKNGTAHALNVLYRRGGRMAVYAGVAMPFDKLEEVDEKALEARAQVAVAAIPPKVAAWRGMTEYGVWPL